MVLSISETPRELAICLEIPVGQCHRLSALPAGHLPPLPIFGLRGTLHCDFPYRGSKKGLIFFFFKGAIDPSTGPENLGFFRLLQAW